MRFKGKVFDRLSAWNSGNIKDTIVVVGAPRSGTTWLAELLRELPGYKLVNEPLRLSTQPAARAAGFDWRTHVAPHEKRPEMSRYLSDVLRGDVELGPAWHFRSENTFAKLWEHTTHDRVIVKFCRAGRMLHWMTQQFDTRGIVVIIRHPCAVIASMLNMRDNWKPRDIQKKAVLKRLKGLISDSLIDELTSIPGATDTWVGHLAIQWSLDYYFALHGHAVESNDYPPGL